MKLRELKDVINDIGKPIGHIAGFCDSYEQMFDRCILEVKEGIVFLDTTDDPESEALPAVPDVMAALLALSQDCDDYDIIFSGFDNQESLCCLIREVSCAKSFVSQSGNAGLSLQGREPLPYRDEDLFVARIVIEDERAKKLNEKFFDFLRQCSDSCGVDDDDVFMVESFDDVLFISFVSSELVGINLVALLSGIFKGVFFCLTPLTTNQHIERVTNDHACKYWKKYRGVYYPANMRYYPFKDDEYCVLGETEYCAMECDTEKEVEQFLAAHNPDVTVGDLVQRISSSYIINPLDLIID